MILLPGFRLRVPEAKFRPRCVWLGDQIGVHETLLNENQRK